ncbi:MAG: ketoacyl-ACP synthase III [Phycisphaeraceae bacterium]|nr:ketoacyl-ACP synthase III [Phycisphaerales bacterium]MCB9861305.1 ketoacyl-ACP synthase III [Phycisphaeraceae bacterium]
MPSAIQTRDTSPVLASIAGLGHYLPETTITNKDLEALVDTSDSWITSRTGISSRRRAGAGQATSDLAIEASRAALDDANIDAADIDMILLATATPDLPVPSSACIIQNALGASNAGAMDINAGCSGFLYALHTACAFVRSGQARRVLAIGSETLTRITDYTDRRTCVLFGDGAGACVIADHGRMDLIYSQVRSDGSQADLIQIPAGGSRTPASSQTIADHQHFLQLDGTRVFKQAVRRMVEAAHEGLAATGLSASDVSWVIPHQANARILTAVAEQVGIAVPRVVNDIAETGNTSAASVPIALNRARSAGVFEPGQLIMLLAFGAGLTWACQILRYTDSNE